MADTQESGKTILVVDDEAEIRSVVREILELEGYAVLEAASGQEALDRAQAHPGSIDLLLTDIVMPGMNGVQLADRVRRLRPGTRVLFMSGFTTDVVMVDCGVQPGEPFIAKPFSGPALREKVRSLVQRSPFLRRPLSPPTT